MRLIYPIPVCGSNWSWGTGTRAVRGWAPNPGTGGMVDAAGNIIAKSAPGVEAIVIGDLPVARRTGLSADA